MSRLLMAIMICGATTASSAQEYVNGYTYVAPSYYLTPPVVTYPSVNVFPPYYMAQPVAVRQPYWVPQPIPAATYTVPTYTVPTANVVTYPVVPAPTYYQERVKYRPREIEYTLRGPYGQKEKVEIEYHRRGIEVEYKRR